MLLPDAEQENNADDTNESEKTSDDNWYRQCCSVVDTLVNAIGEGDHDSVDKTLRQGHSSGNLENYRVIIGKKIKKAEKEMAALELLRDKIDIVLKDSEAPDDTHEGGKTDI